MGSTVLQYMRTIRSGVKIQEDFENPNWIADNGWTVLNGNPVNSAMQAKRGTKSLILDSSCPLIQCLGTQQLFPAQEGVEGSLVYTAWFYDDLSAVDASIGFYESVGGNYNSIEIVSTSYGANVHGTVLGVTPRTLGWHRFAIIIRDDSLYHTTSFQIDDVEIYNKSSASPAINFWAGITAGGSAGSGSCFMDLVGVYMGMAIEVGFTENDESGVLPSIWIFRAEAFPFASDFFIGIGQIAGNGYVTVTGQKHYTANFFQSSVITDHDGPHKLIFAIDSRGGYDPDFWSQAIDCYPGDKLLLSILDFKRRVTSISPRRTPQIVTKESPGKLQETLLWNVRDMVSFTVGGLLDEIRTKVSQWWSYAYQGGVYSMAVDRAKVFKGIMETTSTGTYINQVQISGLACDVHCKPGARLRVTGGPLEQVIEVKSVQYATGSVAVITLTHQLDDFYFKGGEFLVTSEFYYPAVVNKDSGLGLTQIQNTPRRWDFSNSFSSVAEDLNANVTS